MQTKAAPASPASHVAFVHAKAVELGKHALRMTTASGSGHPSSSLSIAHLVVEMMYRQMRFDPGDPWNPNNDRFVLSEGHAVPIVYAAYADLGGVVGKHPAHARTLAIDELARLRELDSVLDGHPNPAEGFPFFDAATGSLGQGLSAAAGLAIAARLSGIDKRIFCVIGDGEAREGQIWEAIDFIVDHKLSSVCAIFNCNGHGQAAEVSEQQSAATLAAKLAAFHWEVVEIDGHDPAEVAAALERAGRGDRPLAVIARTVKGWGVGSMVGKNYHGKPMTKAEVDGACAELDATAARLGASNATPARPTAPPAAQGRKAAFAALPPFAEGLKRAGLSAALDKKKLATRVAYGAAIAALGDVAADVVVLDADVSNSTFANIFQARHPDRFIECKIAEQNMITVGVGLSSAGKIPFASSFTKFLARATDQIDMAAISRANLKIVGSHSGVSLAADGPSQMSVSDLAYFRSLTRVDAGEGRPACVVFHPADPICAYRCVQLMADFKGMCFLRTHRPDAPFLYAFDETFEIGGVKQLRRGDRLTIVSAGYMLYTALEAADQLEKAGVKCNVFDAYTLPVSAGSILAAARQAGGVILTVEDNYIGGLHAELAEAAAAAGDVRVIGMTANRMPKSALTPEEVFTYVGVGLEQIVDRAKALAG
jgi:transketolase